MSSRHSLGSCSLISVVLIVALLLSTLPAVAADFDRDGYADLAIGVSWEDVGSTQDAGAVNVLDMHVRHRRRDFAKLWHAP